MAATIASGLLLNERPSNSIPALESPSISTATPWGISLISAMQRRVRVTLLAASIIHRLTDYHPADIDGGLAPYMADAINAPGFEIATVLLPRPGDNKGTKVINRYAPQRRMNVPFSCPIPFASLMPLLYEPA